MREKTKPKLKEALRGPFPLVQRELREVEALIRDQVRAFDPGVEPYVSYICDTAGKRIRPALAILAGGATGGVEANHLKLGTILELIHMATLVHDDIIDGASTRRQVPTANAKWGEGIAVLLGDALFSHALMLSTEFNDLHLSREIAKASRAVCEGEVIQTQRRFDLNLTQADYFKVIEMKTGALFEAATRLAAYISGATEDQQQALADFGMKLGTAYQIYDDCLDLVGTEDQFGKTLRTDLEKGKLTLPMLYLLEGASPAKREKLHKRIIKQEALDLPVLVGIADYEGAIEEALVCAGKLLDEGEAGLGCLPDGRYHDALVDIANFLRSLISKLTD